MNLNTRGALFPSGSGSGSVSTFKSSSSSSAPLSSEVKGLDWLTNKSFNPTSAQESQQRHEENICEEITEHQQYEVESGDQVLQKETSCPSSSLEERNEKYKSHQSEKSKNVATYGASDVQYISKFIKETRHSLQNKQESDSSEDASAKSGGDSSPSSEDRTSQYESSRVKHKELQSDEQTRDTDRKRKGKKRHHTSRGDSPTGRQKKKKKKHHRSERSPEKDKRKRHKKKMKHKDHKESKSYDSLKKRPSSMWIDDIGSIPATPFYLDEKSDKNNLCFKSLNFTDAAFYRRLGKSCLGLNQDKQKIEWDSKEKQKSSKKHASSVKRYFEKSLEDSDERVAASETKDDQNGSSFIDMLQMEYIPVTIKKSSADEQHPPGEDLKPSSENFLSEKVAFYNQQLRENPYDAPMWLEFVRFQDHAAATPSSASAGNEAATLKHSKKQKLIQEKKMVILEKALKANPTNQELQLEQLELLRETLDPAQLVKRWDATIRHHAENLAMWQHYLTFQRSCFTKFTVSRLASLHSKFLSAMQSQDTKVQFGIVLQVCNFWRQSGHTEKAVALFQALVEFNFFCPEHVVQSTTLEGKIAFFEPFWDSNEPCFGQTGAKGWAKWVHRKEKGGWSTNEQQESMSVEDEESVIAKTDDTHEAWLKEEVHRESTQFLPWKPGAGQTEDDCEDPDRMVLFDDISPFLLNLDTPEEKFELILTFLDFLGVMRPQRLSSFQRVSPKSFEHPAEVFVGEGSGSRKSAGSRGLLLNGEQLPQIFELGNEYKASKSSGNGKVCGAQAIIVYADTIITQAMPLLPKEAQLQLTLLRMQYNLPVVDTLADGKQQKKRLKEGRKYAKKLLSLEDNRSNLQLWEEYAKWEWYNGNQTEGQRIFETALTFADLNLTEVTDSYDVTTLLSSYSSFKLGITSDHVISSLPIKCNAEQGKAVNIDPGSKRGAETEANKFLLCKQEVLHALTTLGERGKYTPFSSLKDASVSAARILKARKGYVELFDRTMKSYASAIENFQTHSSSRMSSESLRCLDQEGSHLVHVALCYAVFQYLSVSMQAAGVVFEETSSDLERLLQQMDRGVDEGGRGNVHRQLEMDAELLMVLYVKVVSLHVRSHPMPLALLRNLLHRALNRYSTNPELLESFIQLEARSHITGRLRRYFDKATSQAEHPVPWLYAISAELRRAQRVEEEAGVSGKETGITNRVHSLFDKATSNRHTRHCILIWRLYMHFAVQQGDLKRGKAIFYRALQHCPSAKILYLDAVRYFPEELQEVLDLLMEKELRLRAPLEEVELLMRVEKSNQKKE